MSHTYYFEYGLNVLQGFIRINLGDLIVILITVSLPPLSLSLDPPTHSMADPVVVSYGGAGGVYTLTPLEPTTGTTPGDHCNPMQPAITATNMSHSI